MKVHLQPQKDYWGMKGNLSDRVRPNVEAAARGVAHYLRHGAMKRSIV